MSAIFGKQSAAKQLAEALKSSIQQGKWLAGAQLPTVRKLASDYQVSLNTVHAALKRLEADDLIECRPRQGGFVKALSEWADHVSAGAPRQVAVVRPISPGEEPGVDQTQQTGRIIHGIERELAGHDLHPVLLSFGLFDVDSTEKILRQIDRLRPQLLGVIVFAVGELKEDLFASLDAMELTWVTINRLSHRTLENFVTTDATQCGEEIGACLADNQISRAVVIGTSTQSNVDRIGGLLKGYRQRSNRTLSIEYLHLHDWREGPAFQAMLQYLQNSSSRLPETVVGLGDIIAVGAMRALQSRGVQVPAEVKVISTTDLAIAEYATPTLSTFHSPLEELGHMAGAMLLEMIPTGKRRTPGQFLSGQMVFRESFPASPAAKLTATANGPARTVAFV